MSVNGLSQEPVFLHSVPKINSNVPFDAFFSKISHFLIKETKNVIRFSFIKVSISKNFLRLHSKLTPEIYQKFENLHGGKCKTGSKCQLRHFLFFEKLLSLKKNEKHFRIFYHKKRNSYKFHESTIKNDFDNMS